MAAEEKEEEEEKKREENRAVGILYAKETHDHVWYICYVCFSTILDI